MPFESRRAWLISYSSSSLACVCSQEDWKIRGFVAQHPCHHAACPGWRSLNIDGWVLYMLAVAVHPVLWTCLQHFMEGFQTKPCASYVQRCAGVPSLGMQQCQLLLPQSCFCVLRRPRCTGCLQLAESSLRICTQYSQEPDCQTAVGLC